MDGNSKWYLYSLSTYTAPVTSKLWHLLKSQVLVCPSTGPIWWAQAPFSASYKDTHSLAQICSFACGRLPDIYLDSSVRCFLWIGNGQVQRTLSTHRTERNSRTQASTSYYFIMVLLQALPTVWHVTNQLSQAGDYPSLQEHRTSLHNTQKAVKKTQDNSLAPLKENLAFFINGVVPITVV